MPELAQVAVIDWKGAKWEGAHSSLTIPELLTVLKGFGAMEVLRFIREGISSGELSLCITEDGGKEITLYHLEVLGETRQGHGRETIEWLRHIFKGQIFLELPDKLEDGCVYHPSLLFWLRMYRLGLVDAMDCETFCLGPDSTQDETDRIEQKVLSLLSPTIVNPK